MITSDPQVIAFLLTGGESSRSAQGPILLLIEIITGRRDVLRRVENVQVFYLRDAPGLITGKYRIILQIGKKQHRSSFRITKDAFRQMEAASAERPVKYLTIGERTYWRFQDRWHSDNENLTDEQVHALLVTRGQRRQATINRAQSVVAMTQASRPTGRTAIPSDVRQLVWTRDGGACAQCGANVELQIDHVIPVSLGGSNDEGNLQILCGPCNRLKGASVG